MKGQFRKQGPDRAPGQSHCTCLETLDLKGWYQLECRGKACDGNRDQPEAIWPNSADWHTQTKTLTTHARTHKHYTHTRTHTPLHMCAQMGLSPGCLLTCPAEQYELPRSSGVERPESVTNLRHRAWHLVSNLIFSFFPHSHHFFPASRSQAGVERKASRCRETALPPPVWAGVLSHLPGVHSGPFPSFPGWATPA